MNTIKQESVYEETIRKSRFIALALRVDSEEAFRDRLEEVRHRYPGANHYVYAYSIRERDGRLCVRFNDDGEPKSSAGKPVLAPIQGRELMSVAVVVIRYFGGVKLGVGGLVRAYGGTAAGALDLAGVTPITRRERHQRTVSYSALSDLERQLQAAGAHIVDRDFGAEVTVTYDLEIEE